MSESLLINQTAVESDSQVINGATMGLTAGVLVETDNESTIYANNRAKETFIETQNAIASLGNVLRQEASNIKNLGMKFTELDEKLGNLVKNQ